MQRRRLEVRISPLRPQPPSPPAQYPAATTHVRESSYSILFSYHLIGQLYEYLGGGVVDEVHLRLEHCQLYDGSQRRSVSW